MAGGSHGEWRSLIGLVLLLALCSLPHGYRLLQESNPSDATIGWWLQRLYFVIQGMWLAVFVVRTRGDPSKDDDVAAAHAVEDAEGAAEELGRWFGYQDMSNYTRAVDAKIYA